MVYLIMAGTTFLLVKNHVDLFDDFMKGFSLKALQLNRTKAKNGRHHAGEKLIRASKFKSHPENPRFVFHNKIPKAGSTTMKWLLVALSKRNGFVLDHLKPCVNRETCSERDGGKHLDGPDGEQALVKYIPKSRKSSGSQNYLLLKHHHWLNFSQFGLEAPTYINVARDPVTRYASWYYFERFGWGRNEATRQKFFGEYYSLATCVR